MTLPPASAQAARPVGTLTLDLPDAHMGQVVTRFPPEPSGYLHIGHAKAALLNHLFAKKYEGKLIVRMDDTNPTKEKDEYTQAILQDLETLGISADMYTHTSDYFDIISDYAEKLITSGDAYVDDTPVDQMRIERTIGKDSACRELSIAENLERWNQMKNVTPLGLKCCLRAKIGMSHANKALRDPVLYRCNPTPHQRTGQRFKIYPTYDFACPIVDSIEGVTHALRTNEYHDRNDQYYWFIEHLNLRRPLIWDYSRINFVYTLMSKRKLQLLVDAKRVSGWDDPRFPTIRGLIRRGLTVEALREYIIMQGPSKNTLLLEWDKIWALNKQIIDPIAPRHVAISMENAVKATIDFPSTIEHRILPKHKKNPTVGTKTTVFASTILLEAEDAKLMQVDEEVTLMDWGNAFVRAIHRDKSDVITSIDMSLHLEGDFKLTKKKLTWLADTEDKIPVKLVDYDYLITKKKLEEEDKLEDFLNEKTEFIQEAYADGNIRSLNKGDIIQFERRGYFIYDGDSRMIAIPDGKVKSMSHLGHQKTPVLTVPKTVIPSEMYQMDNIHSSQTIHMNHQHGMYTMPSIHGENDQQEKVNTMLTEKMKEATITETPERMERKEKSAPIAKPTVVEEVKEDIQRLDLRVGRVLSVERHPDADSLYIEKIDLGETEPRTVISGLVKHIEMDEFKGRYIIVVCNLKPSMLRGIKSEAMVLCSGTENKEKVELLVPPANSCVGDRVFVEGVTMCPDDQLNPKKKIFEKIQVDLMTDATGIATYRGAKLRTDRGVITSPTLFSAHIS